MARFNLPSETSINFSSGMDRIFVYVASEVPIFIPMALFAFFSIIFLGGYLAQKGREGRGDLPMWFSIAGYLTSTVAMLMLLIEGLIGVVTVTTTIAVALVGAVWFFFSRDRA